MQKTLATLLLSLSVLGTNVQAQTSVAVSIGINQPGVYGRLTIGDIPPMALVMPQPIIIAPPPVVIDRRPIYLYVPPLHQQQWARYCGRYGACGQPVYFVHDHWVRERYEKEHPGWKKGHDKKHKNEKHGHGKDKHGKGHGRDD